jgi:NAD(P)H-hydrate repair Nnr-like enzyme with NAD(P)H-hydrate dehydratase domain
LEQDGAVLTPHPAEAARLLACTTASVQADRIIAALLARGADAKNALHAGVHLHGAVADAAAEAGRGRCCPADGKVTLWAQLDSKV